MLPLLGEEPRDGALPLCGEKPSASAKARFLQKALGYALTGDTRHECMFILYGATTRNGKGTAMETFLRLMGDYGKTARPETIGMRFGQSGSAPSEDIARLCGARFVNISEPDKKLMLSASLVKTLTGNDTITARYLHENSFEFRPAFKLFVSTNHLPGVNDLTLFKSARVKLIPFERHFSEHEQDKTLKELLAQPESLSGILNWCVEGLKLLESEGLEPPAAVREATERYRHDNDRVQLYMEEMLVADARAEMRTSDAYMLYRGWCERNGYTPENNQHFRAQLENVARVVRKRPMAGGCMTTLLIGYDMSKSL